MAKSSHSRWAWMTHASKLVLRPTSGWCTALRCGSDLTKVWTAPSRVPPVWVRLFEKQVNKGGGITDPPRALGDMLTFEAVVRNYERAGAKSPWHSSLVAILHSIPRGTRGLRCSILLRLPQRRWSRSWTWLHPRDTESVANLIKAIQIAAYPNWRIHGRGFPGDSKVLSRIICRVFLVVF